MPKPKKVVERTVSKATGRTGSGAKRGGRRGGSGGGAITISSVSPSGNVGNPAPTVRATLEAEEANLSKSDIRLYVDGPSRGAFTTAGPPETSATTLACFPLAPTPSR